MSTPSLDTSSAASAVTSSARAGADAPLRDYAAIGDGRTVALVARDGAIDWLCLPDLDSPTVLGGLLDAECGGSWRLAPVEPFVVDRRYRPGTNVLETTFRTATGAARVTDAMVLPGSTLGPQRELVRLIEGLEGTVEWTWQLEPRFGYAQWTTRIGTRHGVPVATSGSSALALRCFDTGTVLVDGKVIGGRFAVHAHRSALFVLSAAEQQPLVLPARGDVETRLAGTASAWERFAGGVHYVGPWRDAVLRSALVLKLLVFARSGAIAAAATTSLPETIGGERNWDYRFCWIRDSAFVLAALLRLECRDEADAFIWWMMQASQRTHPHLAVLYRLDGGSEADEQELPLRGYQASTPVRIGNGAAGQVQLDVYGDLMQAVWYYQAAGGRLDAEVGSRLAEIADLVGDIWRQRDAGLWEVRSGPQHFTQSKMMCWIALDRAIALAAAGCIPGDRTDRWRSVADEIAAFIEENCWSETKGAYVRHPGSDDLDASVLLGVLFAYGDANRDRLRSTVDAVRAELQHGPFVYRYSGEDGLGGEEGAFLTCSFWLVEALAWQDRIAEATALMDELIGLSNDVGLYAEEVDPHTGAFLGNLPQALSHLALINAAVTLAEEHAQ